MATAAATAAATATTPAPAESPGVEEDAAEPQNSSGSVFTAHNNSTAGLQHKGMDRVRPRRGSFLAPGQGQSLQRPGLGV